MTPRDQSSLNLVFVLLVLLIIPLGLRHNPDACLIDVAFMYMSNALFKLDATYGRDVIFTHGPLGFLLNPFTGGGLYLWAVLFQGGVFLANAGMTLAVAFRQKNSFPARLVFLAVLFSGAYLAWLPTSATFLLYAAIASGVFFAVYRANGRIILYFLNAFFLLTSVLFLVKFNTFLLFFSLSLCFLGALAVTGALRPWKALVLVGALLAEIMGGYLLYNASLGDLWRYVELSVEIASQYPVAHSLEISWPWLIPPVMLAVFLGAYVLRYAAYSPVLAFLAAPFAVILLFSSKHAFIRADLAHIPVFFQCLLLMGAWLVLLARDRPSLRIAGAFCAAALLCALVPLTPATMGDGFLNIFRNYDQKNVFASAAEALTFPGGAMKILEDFENHSSLVKSSGFAQSSPTLDPEMARDIRGKTVSSLNSTLPLLFEIDAGRVDFVPFPVYETYSAYSRRLDAMTASMLEDADKSPRYILYPGRDIDGKCPATVTPHTFYALYDHYDLVEYATAYCFVRRDRPRFQELDEILSVVAKPHSKIHPPSFRGELLAKFGLKLNFLGKARALLGAVPEMFLLIKPKGGELVARRIAPDAMNNACLLRGAFYGDDLRRFFKALGQDPEIEFVAISGEGAKYLEAPFDVRFYSAAPR